MRQTLLLKLVTLALTSYWLLMFIVTHMPIPKLDVPPQSDKLVHFIGYALLMFLFRLRQTVAQASGWKRSVWFAAAMLVMYAIVDELLQGPVNRSPDFWDGVADLIGVFIGAVLFSFLWSGLRSLLEKICRENRESTE